MKDLNWETKPREPIYSEDFWYDLTDGGYIKPEELLRDPDTILAVKEAIAIINKFETILRANNLIEEDLNE